MENNSIHNFNKTITIIVVLIGTLFFYSPFRTFAQSSINLPYIEEKQHTDKNAIRDFVLYNYAHVVNDLINGQGIYLDTLYYLLSIEDNKKEMFRKIFIKNIHKIKRIPDFSNCIAGYSESC